MKKLLFIILFLISTSANAWTSQTYLKSFNAKDGRVTLGFTYLEEVDINNKDTLVFHHIFTHFSYKGIIQSVDKAMIMLDCSKNERPMASVRFKIDKKNIIHYVSSGRHSINNEIFNNYCNNKTINDSKIMFDIVNDVLEKQVLSNFGEHEFKVRRKALDIIRLNEQKL